jgi:N utilization substance protein B
MLSRRLLRVKVMQMIYACQKNGDMSIQQSEKDLFHSISKSFELYHLFLLLLSDIQTYASNRIEVGLNKKMPTEDELSPNSRFVENKFLQQLSSNSYLLKYVEATGISWVNNPEIVRSLFDEIVESDLYKQYMDSAFESYAEDKKFIVKLTEKIVSQYEPLYSQVEEQSIFWNDEAEFVMSMVLKTLKEFEEKNGPDQPLQKELKDADDHEFVKTLFRKTLLNQKEFVDLIKKFSQNWDLERVAFMDIVLMQIALTEITEFPGIPVKVTLNEYIEIAKHYSTPKSGLFINGILDKIVSSLKVEGKIVKQGRGLLGDTL